MERFTATALKKMKKLITITERVQVTHSDNICMKVDVWPEYTVICPPSVLFTEKRFSGCLKDGDGERHDF